MATQTLNYRRGLRRYNGRQVIRQLVIYALLVALGLVFILPLLWTVSSSLKPPGSGVKFPPEFLPSAFVWSNYLRVFELIPFLTFFKNSLIVTSLAVTGELLSASLVAFAFARLRFPGRDMLFLLVLATMMIPYPVTMVPTFILWRQLNLVNTFFPLIIPPFLGPAFSIFLLRQFFLTIPQDLEDAARIDGASYFYIYGRIMMPLVKPALTVVTLWTFIGVWNDFFGPLIYLNSNSKFTLALGLTLFRQLYGSKWNLLMAASTAIMVPIIVLFFVFQRRIVEGADLTVGVQG